ncbi:Peroxidase precursor [Salix suchowensis]|nr:Peroxidase precursor [Salix suchowensis]
MAAFASNLLSLAISFLLILIWPSKAVLNYHYYDQACPQAGKIIFETVRNASMHDPKVPARVLRMFFHDCFIRGCDASILLDSTPGNQAEKDGPPNVSVRSFYAIDDAKASLKWLSGGPSWNVLTGRKDGRVSKANDTINLPSPSLNARSGVKDLVALSGGHTLGFSHCSSFEARLQNFSSVHDIDPSMNTQFARDLRGKCPKPNKDHSAGEFLDSTSSAFDNDYYKRVVEGKGVFGSDQALLDDHRSRWIVESFAKDQSLFFREFAASMVKLGNVGVIENGEVRLKCRVVN